MKTRLEIESRFADEIASTSNEEQPDIARTNAVNAIMLSFVLEILLDIRDKLEAK